MGTLAEIHERPAVALSVTIPCHNESDCIDELHARVTKACRNWRARNCLDPI